MSVIIIGIDPGVSGALARFACGTLTDIADMPLDTVNLHRSGADLRDLIGGKKAVTRRSVNAPSLARILREWSAGHSTLVLKEKVGPRPNQNASVFMKADGVLTGVIGGVGLELQEIDPALWKRMMGVPADKKEARKIAIEFFPAWKHLFSRADDHNRAEAALIGLYGVRHLSA